MARPESSQLPRLGVGTGGLDSRTAYEVVSEALGIGYRHVDTAEAYENERAVGEAVAKSAVDRDELFLATKLHSAHLRYDAVLDHAEASRRRLGIETIDLLYVHWPAHTYRPDETFGAFAELHDRGHVEHVGMCNVTPEVLAEARESSDLPISAVQTEFHPLFRPTELVAAARRHGTWLIAHTPLAQGRALRRPEVATVAERRGMTEAQVCLAWLLGKPRVAAVPGASGDHLESNIAALDLDLTPEEVELIESIPPEPRLVDYEFAPWD